MTTKEAKNIALESYLEQLGFMPVNIRKDGNELWYNSPLKTDKTPSFRITVSLNTWYDFALGKGGSILDFVMTYFSCEIGEAFNRLSTKNYLQISERPTAPTLPTKAKTILKSVKPLQNKALIQYLESRCINIVVSKLYLVEVYYKANEKGSNFFALGFKNRSNGYEVRSKIFKGCILSKDITYIEGDRKDAVSIFEGVFDFLALLTENKIDRLKTDVIILNSVAMLPNGMNLINAKGYQKIYAFTDNDQAGNNAMNELKIAYKGKVLDMRYSYSSHKDYNDKIIDSLKLRA